MIYQLGWPELGTGGYTLERSTDDGQQWQAVATLDAGEQRYIDEGLARHTQYWYRLIPDEGQGTPMTVEAETGSEPVTYVEAGTGEWTEGELVETVIEYRYDDLYRLTEANYSDGTFYHYSYDANGNRVNETTTVGEVLSVYDAANRLTSVGGTSYTWDDNGNLIGDGMSQYVFDHANRLLSVTTNGQTTNNQYNGLGDRLVEDGTQFVMDLNTGLTQVLQDGTNRYLYGNGRIGQFAGVESAYFLGGALGSVRQLVDGSGAVTLYRSYAPYGETIASNGTGLTSYSFTGEWDSSSTNLLYLRARFYNPKDGRFFQLDPSKQEKNLYNYASSNPVIFTDPSGLNYINPDYKKILENWVTATKGAYSKDGSNRNCTLHPDDGQFPNDTVDDLFTDFICEYGPAHRDFYYDDGVTVELAHSTSLKHLRADFYSKGAKYFSGKGQMNPIQFFEAKFLDLINGSTPTRFMGIDNVPVTIMDFIGGYDWEVYKTPRNTVKFIIDDQKDLVSGTRINFTRQGAQDISIEEYLQNPQKYNRIPTYEINPIMLFDWSRYNLISILSEKSSIARNPGKGDGSGGGTMTYTYSWEEKFVENWACTDLFYNPYYGPMVLDQLPIPDNQLLPSLNQ